MNWFEKMCRNVGLMVHGICHPDEPGQVVRKHVEEEERDGLILRRTTIEEIELRKSSPSQADGTRTPRAPRSS